MSDTIRKTRKTEGFANFVQNKGIDPNRYKQLIDKGMRPAGLMIAFDLSRDSVIKDLNQLARERSLKNWHDLYR